MAARVFVDNFCSVMLCSLLVLLFIVPAPPSLFTDLSFFFGNGVNRGAFG